MSAFIREDLPAPDGPMMAVSWPDLNSPDTPFKIVFEAAKKQNLRISTGLVGVSSVKLGVAKLEFVCKLKRSAKGGHSTQLGEVNK